MRRRLPLIRSASQRFFRYFTLDDGGQYEGHHGRRRHHAANAHQLRL